MANTTPWAPEDWSDPREGLRKLAQSLNRFLKGHGNNIKTSVTLTANAATTTITDSRIERDTMLLLQPTTANAAAALTNVYQTLPNTTSGQAVLNHANNAQTDRTFYVTLSG